MDDGKGKEEGVIERDIKGEEGRREGKDEE